MLVKKIIEWVMTLNYDWIVHKARKELNEFRKGSYIITEEFIRNITSIYTSYMTKLINIPISGNSYYDLKKKYNICNCITKKDFVKKLISINPYYSMVLVTNFYEEKLDRIKILNYELLFNEYKEVLITGKLSMSNLQYISHFKVLNVLDENKKSIDITHSTFDFNINKKELNFKLKCHNKCKNKLINHNPITLEVEVFGLKKDSLTNILDYVHTAIYHMEQGNIKYAFYALYSSFDNLVKILYDGYFEFLIDNYEKIKNSADKIGKDLLDFSEGMYCDDFCSFKDNCEYKDGSSQDKKQEHCYYVQFIEDEHNKLINQEIINYKKVIDDYLKKEIREFSNKQRNLQTKYKLVFDRINTNRSYDELVLKLDYLYNFTDIRNKIAHGVSVELKTLDLENMLYNLLTVIFAFARSFSSEEDMWEFLFSG
ncbi:hypothetical protein [Sporosalibacterium faouarense]|uniref:hypothetical protein n=1 Tax=Sporosalibacterium faouarense TaxID=516123 RepID=UPI00192CDEA4|nr:hypothetical protein [Sporosalibacterium faouarense]